MGITTTYFPEEVKIELEAVANMEHRPEAEIIREADFTYLEQRRHGRWPHSFGMVADGSSDPAQDECYLAEKDGAS